MRILVPVSKGIDLYCLVSIAVGKLVLKAMEKPHDGFVKSRSLRAALLEDIPLMRPLSKMWRGSLRAMIRWTQ